MLHCNILLWLTDHVMRECTWIRCPCSGEEDVMFEVCGLQYNNMIHTYVVHTNVREKLSLHD